MGSLLLGIALGVASWWRLLAATAAIAAWITVVATLHDSFAENHDSLLVVLAIAMAFGLGGLLRVWAFALLPILTLSAVPLSHAGDSDGTSPWVYTAIDSVVILSPPFLLAALIATGVRLFRGPPHHTKTSSPV